jgi:hypothetical protein
MTCKVTPLASSQMSDVKKALEIERRTTTERKSAVIPFLADDTIQISNKKDEFVTAADIIPKDVEDQWDKRAIVLRYIYERSLTLRSRLLECGLQ